MSLIAVRIDPAATLCKYFPDVAGDPVRLARTPGHRFNASISSKSGIEPVPAAPRAVLEAYALHLGSVPRAPRRESPSSCTEAGTSHARMRQLRRSPSGGRRRRTLAEEHLEQVGVAGTLDLEALGLRLPTVQLAVALALQATGRG